MYKRKHNCKRQHDNDRRENTLRCPVCREKLVYETNVKVPREFRSGPGDLTQCPHCRVMLEYVGDGVSLDLEPARRERVQVFEKLSREGDPALTVPEVIEYVRRYRSMPEPASAPVDAARLRLGRRSIVGSEKARVNSD
jgi:DNA-directed RNA polymerase subunit RPC12/RpoP